MMSLLLVRAGLWAAALLVLGAACAVDVRRRIIPNEATAAIAGCGFALSLALRPGSTWISLLAAVALFLGLSGFVHYGLLGGGDAKLIAAVTLLVPPTGVGQLIVEIAVAGGLLSVIYLVMYRRQARSRGARIAALPRRAPRASHRRHFSAAGTEGSVPYSLAVFGGLVAYVVSELSLCLSGTSCLF